MKKLTKAQRRKCINILVDEEMDTFANSYESLETIIANMLVYGKKQPPYDEMNDQDLLSTLYDVAMDKHDLEVGSNNRDLMRWADKQEVYDYVGSI